MSGESWAWRARAESFGAAAEEYDAARPRYPAEIVAAVLAGDPPAPAAGSPGPVRVLDVGTGTGIFARALEAAGAAVVGAEFDPEMATVARRSGLTVHVGRFEDLDLPERFDRITVAQAWHWIDPAAGVAVVRRLLAPGGQLWLLWNVADLDPTVEAATDAVYARFTTVTRGGISRGVTAPAAAAAQEFFDAVPGARVRSLEVPWRSEQTAQEWVRMVATFSDHLTLPPDVRTPLLAALAEAVDAIGGVVTLDYTTRAVVVAGLAD